MALESVIEALGGGRPAAPPQMRGQAEAEAVLRDLADESVGANDSPAQAAERDRAMAEAYRRARPQGGSITFEPRGAAPAPAAAQPWQRVPFGETAPGNDLEAAISALSPKAPTEAPGRVNPKYVPDSGPAPARAPAAALSPQEAIAAGRTQKPWMERLTAPLEVGASVVSSALATPIAAAAGLVRGVTGGKYGTAEGAREAQARAAEVLDSLTYQPRTEAGMEALQTFSKAFDASKLGGIGPAEGLALGNAVAQIPRGGVSQGVRMALGADRPLALPTQAAAPVAAAPQAALGGSVVASGVQPRAAGEALAAQARDPILAAKIKEAAARPDFNLRAAERMVEADTLPVPIRLTKGDATQDPFTISLERNRRGADPAMVARINEYNKGLIDNLDAIREKAAPDVYATSRPALGEALIDAYKAKDAALNKVISARYQALEDANGGAFPMDAKAFAAAADEALHKALKFEFLPSGLEKQLANFREGAPMNFEQFEAMRTNLANIMRSNADGNVKAAASIVRDALENLPMPAGAEHLKPLADAARAAARERFALLERDPAYKAVVRGKAGADNFIDKFVLNADRQNVATMKANLAQDPQALQTMAAGAMARLREKAGITAGDAKTEIFRAAGYNKAVENLAPKLDLLFDPEAKQLVQQLGNVANYTKAQPAGSFVNNSNTAVAALGELAQSGFEKIANKATLGTYGVGKRVFDFVRERKELGQSLQTGAGLRLKELKR